MPQTSGYLEQAQALAASGEIGEAIILLEECVATCRDSAPVCKLLAELNLRIDEVRAFQNWCHEALRIDEKDPEPHRMLAAYFSSHGRDFEAEEELAAAARKQER
jgi:hypothetical protein